MPFFNREKDIKRVKAILSGEPNLVYFVYGPINSGKTALLTKVFEELPEDYRVFYINFRWRYVAYINDLLQVLFDIKRGEHQEDIQEIVREFFKEGAKAVKRFKGIPIPEKIFDVIFGEKKVENIFKYLEEIFECIKENGDVPVFVLDEMQSIKEVINTAGKPVIHELFNFLVGMTKERHLCHCLCATSDCLFIEDVYSNARLEGRAEYILLDDLGREEALRVYEEFGFKEKELVWEYIGGKLGDMIRLFEKKKEGLSEREALEDLAGDSRARLKNFLEGIEYGRVIFNFKEEEVKVEVKEVIEALRVFKEEEVVEKERINPVYRNFLVSENVLFYNPVKEVVRPQSRLMWRAIREVL